MFKRILVPLDGSAFAERALPHAEQFAKIFGANIILIRVLDVPSNHEKVAAIDPLNWQIRKTNAEMYLKEIAAKIDERLSEVDPVLDNKTEGKEKVQFAIREGRAAENIVNFAHNENIDLVIISTHGSGGLSRWNISSVTHKIINRIYLPILIVRTYQETETDLSLKNYRKILIPVDSSRRAECVFSTAVALARGKAKPDAEKNLDVTSSNIDQTADNIPTELILVSVINPPELPIPEPYPDEIIQIQEKFLTISRQAVNEYLDKMKKQLGSECTTFLLENKNVPTAIQELAEQENIDLILMSAHGHSGQFNYPYGSIVRNTIDHGSTSILIIQDIPRSQVKPTQAEIAAEKYGGR